MLGLLIQTFGITAVQADTLVMPGYQGSGASAKKNTWVKKKDGYYYIGKKGTYLKNGLHKVKGTYYYFDKKGRRFSGKKKDMMGFYAVFSKKNGKFVHRYVPLKVKSVSKRVGIEGYAYAAENKLNRYHYLIPWSKAKLVDAKGRPIKKSAFRKGDIVRVYTTSWTIKESAPAKFYPIIKIQLVKHTK